MSLDRKASKDKQQLDNNINTYLFDVEYYSSMEEPQGDKLLEQLEQQIHQDLQKLTSSDIEELYTKYDQQNKELLEEIAWREEAGKSRNIHREKVQRCLADLLTIMKKNSDKTTKTGKTKKYKKTSSKNLEQQAVTSQQPKNTVKPSLDISHFSLKDNVEEDDTDENFFDDDIDIEEKINQAKSLIPQIDPEPGVTLEIDDPFIVEDDPFAAGDPFVVEDSFDSELKIQENPSPVQKDTKKINSSSLKKTTARINIEDKKKQKQTRKIQAKKTATKAQTRKLKKIKNFDLSETDDLAKEPKKLSDKTKPQKLKSKPIKKDKPKPQPKLEDEWEDGWEPEPQIDENRWKAGWEPEPEEDKDEYFEEKRQDLAYYNQEQKIQKIVKKYLEKIPQVDWQERDEKEKSQQFKRQQEELEQKKRNLKKLKTTKRRKKASPKSANKKKKKKWWTFLK